MIDLSKETEVNLSKETEVFCTKDSLLNHEKSVHTENVPLLKETYCEIEVNVQNPEKRPIPRTFRLNESMDVDLNNKDISLDIPESENDDKTSGIYDLENNMESVCKPKKTIESPVIAENEAIPQDHALQNCRLSDDHLAPDLLASPPRRTGCRLREICLQRWRGIGVPGRRSA